MINLSKLKKTDYIIIAVLLALVIGIVFAVLHGTNQSDADSISVENNETAIDYTSFNGKRFGILTGSSFESATLQTFPDSEYFYFDTVSDLIAALRANKIDAFLEDEPVARMAHNANSSIDYIQKPLVNDDYCFAFNKSERASKLLDEFNKYLAEIKAEIENIDRIINRDNTRIQDDILIKLYQDLEL